MAKEKELAAEPENEIQKKDDFLEIVQSKESLKCILTDAELLDLSRKNSQAGSEIIQKNEELTAVKSQFKAEIDRLTALRNGYDTLINNGWEFRSTEINIIKDYRSGEIRYERLDTGEVFRTRQMDTSERQRALELES